MKPGILLRAEALTATAFQPFGEVMEASPDARQFAINDGNTLRFHDLARLDAGPDGRLMVSIFRGQPRTAAVRGAHDGAPPAWQSGLHAALRAAVSGGGGPARRSPHCRYAEGLLAGPQQGVNYAAGVWHHPCWRCTRPATFWYWTGTAAPPTAMKCNCHARY
jgi:ureidoglycolate lyase